MEDQLEFVCWFQLQPENVEKTVWPPYSLDINALNYFFWLYTMMQVQWRKLAMIDELKETVKGVMHIILEEMVREAETNMGKRCQACEAASGGHFKAFLKQFQK